VVNCHFLHQREEWKVTDILFNPMLMMMVMPLLLITVLPKMMQVRPRISLPAKTETLL
jgi:hypothetical protein